MEIIMSEQSLVVTNKEQASCDLGGEAIILNFKDGVYYGLDTLGGLIWNLIQEPKTISELRDFIVTRFDVEQERCEQDLKKLLQELLTKGLIEIKHETVK